MAVKLLWWQKGEVLKIEWFGMFQKYIARKLCLKNNVIIVVLGPQKAGTTAIAKLIGYLSGMNVSTDPLYMMDLGQGGAAMSIIDQPEVLRHFLRKRPDLFKQPIVKDPDFIFAYPEIKNYYKNAKYIFVIRNPLDIIRSISNRLGLNPRVSTALPKIHEMKEGNQHWQMVLSGELPRQQNRSNNYVTNLAYRWCLAVETYMSHKNEMCLVRYEDFMGDKKGYIEDLALKLGMLKMADVTEYLDIQYQRKGDSSVDISEYFGIDNAIEVETVCGEYMHELGYLKKYIV